MADTNITLNDFFSHLDTGSITKLNASVFNVLFTYNLLWLCVLAFSIRIVSGSLLYYFPNLTLIPGVRVFDSTIRFGGAVLMAVTVYLSGTTTAMKILGILTLVATLLSFGIFIKRLGHMVMAGYYHRDLNVAAHAPYCVKVNGKYFSLPSFPHAIVLANVDGVSTFQDQKVNVPSIGEASVRVFSPTKSFEYNRPERTAKSYVIHYGDNSNAEIATYIPSTMKRA